MSKKIKLEFSPREYALVIEALSRCIREEQLVFSMSKKIKLEFSPREYGLVIEALSRCIHEEREKAGKSINIESMNKHNKKSSEFKELQRNLIIQANT